jgi:hypothetical protein
MSKYLVFRLFTGLLKPFSKAARARRMSAFSEIMKPQADMRILDLGGQPEIWDTVEPILDITCLNLPGIARTEHSTHHKITYVEGNACCMPNYHPGDFDLIFSNSVIEHVGSLEQQTRFANEVLRLSSRYWIQTPSKYFPIEAHCGMPFWWFYPDWLRQYFLRRWSKILPVWTEMVATTSVLSEQTLRALFPGCAIRIEWLLFPKSITAYFLAESNREYTGLFKNT